MPSRELGWVRVSGNYRCVSLQLPNAPDCEFDGGIVRGETSTDGLLRRLANFLKDSLSGV